MLIGICGKAGAGKDTFADLFLNQYKDYERYSFAVPLKEFCKDLFKLNDDDVYGEYKNTVKNITIYNWRCKLLSNLYYHFPDYLNSRESENDFLVNWFLHSVLFRLNFTFTKKDPINDNKCEIINFKTSPRVLLQLVGTEFIRNGIQEDLWVDLAERKLLKQPNLIVPDLRFPDELNFFKKNDGLVIKIVRNESYLHKLELSNHASESGIPDSLVDYIIENNGTIDDLSIKINNLTKFGNIFECM